ncbi:hypothetical protein ACTXPD_18585 [Vreelandella alkaliphila]|uniref:Uncharacterized protein n=1 Tax=Halomonas campaniensis TaxID=213554 RepID=A0A3D0KH10_9GAMM|nr:MULTISPECIES: hypothetical protein [Halomonas]HCA02645.1 hypothetical protein [Halomonas campaniensis]
MPGEDVKGAYWGSRWFAVTDDPKTARVEQVDLVSDGVIGTSDRVICPATPELEGCQSCESEEDAVKKRILAQTESKIVELICAIELSKLRIENNRLLKDKTELAQNSDSNDRLDIKKWTEELKELRQLRRAKVIVA